MTDQNAGGGAIDTIPQSFVRVENLVVAVVGSQGTAHPPCPTVNAHCAHVWATAQGSTSVRIAGQPVVRADDVDTCGHARVGGSSILRVG
jgi:uncharacterized Zn-binding protein involved in type VI secretion